MSEEVKEVKKETKETQVKARAKAKPEFKYTVNEFVNSNLFAVPREVIITAFRRAGIKEATEAEGKRIVNNYLKKEIK